MKRPELLNGLIALVAGLLFGAGLLVSGMTRPEKVLGFLDVFGNWDASLALVMAAAVAVHGLAYRLIKGRATPLLGSQWSLPTRRDIDSKLVAGAALFGVGWGMSGYCPGPAMVSLPSATTGVLVFVSALLLGLLVAAKLEARTTVPLNQESRQQGVT